MSSAATAPPSRPIKILMLHGYTQSGPLFQAKTGALRKTLSKAFPAGVELVYPTAPLRLTPADESFLAGTGTAGDGDVGGRKGKEEEVVLDAWAWWRRKSCNASSSSSSSSGSASTTSKADGNAESYLYQGIEETFTALARLLVDAGPFDGVIGFSQGAAAAAMLASLLEDGRREAFEAARASKEGGAGIRFPACFVAPRNEQNGSNDDNHNDNNPTNHKSPAPTTTPTPTLIHPPLRFAVSYSGFAAPRGPTSPYAAFYDPPIRTPVLHFLGSQDVVVEEKRSLALVEACAAREERFVVYHPGGHFLPSTQKASVNALVGFIKEVLREEGGGGGGGESEDGVGEMDVPF